MQANKKTLLQEYKDYLVICGLAQTSFVSYSKVAEAFILSMPSDLSQITREEVYEYLKSFKELSIASQNARRAQIRKILVFLSENNSHFNQIQIPDLKQSRSIPKVFTEEQMRDILARFKSKDKRWIDRRNYALVILLYATGLRVSEALNLQWSEVENGWLRVNQGKGGKDRYVPIPEQAEEALHEYKKACPFSLTKTMFANQQGTPLSRLGVYRMLQDSIGVGPHTLRHCFATHLIQNGCEISIVSDFLGHSSLHTTQFYTHIQNKHLQETVRNCHPMSEERSHA